MRTRAFTEISVVSIVCFKLHTDEYFSSSCLEVCRHTYASVNRTGIGLAGGLCLFDSKPFPGLISTYCIRIDEAHGNYFKPMISEIYCGTLWRMVPDIQL